MAASLQHNLIPVPQTTLNAGGSNSSVLVQHVISNADELASVFRPMRPTTDEVTNTLEAVFFELVDDIALGVVFDMHRALKKGYFLLSDTDDESLKQFEIIDRPGFDVFGQLPPSRGRANGGSSSANTAGNLNHQYECPCPNCGRTMAVSRFAPHLEKCMIGLGRTSGRIASRRLADLGAFLFADRSLSSASSDTASSASRSSLGEDDFEWTVNGPKGNAGGSKSLKRSRTTVQRKQLTAPTPPTTSQTSDSNGSHSLTTPLSVDARLSGSTTPSATPSGTTPRRQASTGKRSRQPSKAKQSEQSSSASKNVAVLETTYPYSNVNSKTPSSTCGGLASGSGRSIGNVFESLAAEMFVSGNSSSSGSGSTKGRVG